MDQISNHIASNPEVCGGKPCIRGTRIRVWDIHVLHNLRGNSPAEILTAYPQLSLSNVHAALSYYLDHRDEIEVQMKEAESVAESLNVESTHFSKLRATLLNRESDEDSIPS